MTSLTLGFLFFSATSQSGDVERVAKATGAKVQTTVNNLDKAALGHCATFEEKQVRELSN